jgi:hypothetical protein
MGMKRVRGFFSNEDGLRDARLAALFAIIAICAWLIRSIIRSMIK